MPEGETFTVVLILVLVEDSLREKLDSFLAKYLAKS